MYKTLNRFHIKRVNDNNYTVVVSDMFGRITAVVNNLPNKKAALARIRMYDPFFKITNSNIKEETNPVALWIAYKKGGMKCEHCGTTANLTFHHVDPATKEFNISEAPKLGKSIRQVKAELKKCIPLCVACHRKIHSNTGGIDDDIVSMETEKQEQVSIL